MSDVSTYAGVGVTVVLALIGGAVYVHKLRDELRKEVEAKMDAHAVVAHEAVAKCAEDTRTWVKELKDIADKERERMWKAIDGVVALGSTVAVMAKGVESLGERFADYKSSNDRATDEIKHTTRNTAAKVDALQMQQAKLEAKKEKPDA